MLPQASSIAAGTRGQLVSSAPNESASSHQVVQKSVAASQPQQKVTSEDLKNIASALQKQFSQVAPELQFSVDKASGEAIIIVTDRTTNTVIQQIPSEEAMRVTKEIDQYLQHHGLLLNRKA